MKGTMYGLQMGGEEEPREHPKLTKEERRSLDDAIRLLGTHPLPRVIFNERVKIVSGLKKIRERFK